MLGKIVKWLVKKVAEAWREDQPFERVSKTHLLTNCLVRDQIDLPAGPDMKVIVTIHYGQGNDEVLELNWNRGLHYHLKRKGPEAIVELELMSIMPNAEVHKMVVAEEVTFKLYVESELGGDVWTMSTGPLKLTHYGGSIGFIGPVDECLNFSGPARFLQPWHKMVNDKVNIA